MVRRHRDRVADAALRLQRHLAGDELLRALEVGLEVALERLEEEALVDELDPLLRDDAA